MQSLLLALAHFLSTAFRRRLSLQLEVVALRHQLAVYERSRPRRFRIEPGDRVLWSLLARLWPAWRQGLRFVQTRIVLKWQTRRFRDHWRRKSQRGGPVIGTLRRECLDNVIVLHERHLRRVLRSHIDFYHRWRVHQSLETDAPEHRPVQPPELGKVVEFPDVGDFQRHYERCAG